MNQQRARRARRGETRMTFKREGVQGKKRYRRFAGVTKKSIIMHETTCWTEDGERKVGAVTYYYDRRTQKKLEEIVLNEPERLHQHWYELLLKTPNNYIAYGLCNKWD